MGISIDPTTTSIHVTSPRQTPEPASRRFAEVLQDGARALISGVSGAVGALPGGPLLSAAVRGAGGAASATAAEGPGGTSGPETGSSEMERVMQESQSFNLYYLQIQEGMSRENRRYSALSNVMKARHETAKSAIGNIR
jgi:hypothetical protein